MGTSTFPIPLPMMLLRALFLCGRSSFGSRSSFCAWVRWYLSDVDLHEAGDEAILLQRDDQVNDGGEGEHHKHCRKGASSEQIPRCFPNTTSALPGRHGISPHAPGRASPQNSGSWKWLPPLTKKMMEKRPADTSSPVSISASGLLQDSRVGSSTRALPGSEALFVPVQVKAPFVPPQF